MTTKEKFTVSGSQLVGKVKQLIHEGNIRRVRLLHEGRTVIEIPLTIGAPASLSHLTTIPTATWRTSSRISLSAAMPIWLLSW